MLIMLFRSLPIVALALFFLATSPVFGSQAEIQEIIDFLDEQIASTPSQEEKAKLCCYRARNYVKLKDIDRAEQDYLEALEYEFSGWILHEYSYFLYRTGEYERAYRAAAKVLEDFPQFKHSASKLKEQAFDKYREEFELANPPTIIMDEEVNTERVSRHDIIKKLGPRKEVKIYATDLRKSSSSRSSAKKPKKTAAKKTATKKKRRS